MELKEGMYYTRSENGRLGLCKCEGMTPEQYVETYKKRYHVKKASYNIIDLIEEGDYVNGYEVTSKDQFLGIGNHDWYIADYEIKSIVTKEQFSSMEYKVNE